MSPRLLLRTNPKLFTFPTTHHALRCLLAPRPGFTAISHPDAVIPLAHARSYSSAKRRPPPRQKQTHYNDPLGHSSLRLSPRAERELRAIGLGSDQADNLLKVTRTIAVDDRGVRLAYDFLRNREYWLQSPLNIPKAYQNFWWRLRAPTSGKVDVLGDIADIGPHSDQVIGDACRIIAIQLLEVGEADKDINYMSWGCFMLELAVLFKNCRAAAHLLNYYNDPTRANMLAQAQLQTSTREADVLVRDSATQRPAETPPAAMLAYLRQEYSPQKIFLQNPRQLQWGYTISEHIPVTALRFVQDTQPWDQCAHPAHIRLQILDHCLSRNIALPKLPLEDMLEERNLVLVDLVAINDPKASIILAAQEDAPVDMFSPDWERLLLSASAGAYPRACLLLSIHYLRKERIFPFDEKASERLEGSLGLEFGRIAILAFLDEETAFMTVTTAYAALCRGSGDYRRGLDILKETLAFVEESPNLPRSYKNKLEDHIYDYTSKDPNWRGRWDQKSIDESLKPLDPDAAMRSTRIWLRKINWLHKSSQSSSQDSSTNFED